MVATGCIELNDNLLKIDDKEYKLRSTKEPGKYKAGHCIVFMQYKNSILYKLQLITPNKAISYYIATDVIAAGHETKFTN